MRLALTVWDGRISPVFDVCREALILNIKGKTVLSMSSEPIETSNAFLKIKRLMDLGVETLICGAISQPLHRELIACGLEVFGFVAGEIDEVLQSFLSGTMPDPSLAMPGCSDKQNRIRGGQGQGRCRRRGCYRKKGGETKKHVP